ncbi:hypothetical protein V1511DRAFT_492302 [Dipodascopsis uninucleata]
MPTPLLLFKMPFTSAASIQTNYQHFILCKKGYVAIRIPLFKSRTRVLAWHYCITAVDRLLTTFYIVADSLDV